MKIVLFSLKFSPGHINWVSGYYKLFKDAGHEVKTYLADSYYGYMPDMNAACLKSKQDVVNFKPDVLWIINPSEKHLFFSIWLKLRLPVKIFYYYHEPFGGTEIFREGKNAIKALIACVVSSLICLLSYKVVLPSKNSMRKYLKYSRWLNKKAILLPLLYDDECSGNLKKTRSYFSFIGTFAQSHGTDEFISFMRYAVKNDTDICFLIATKSDLTLLLEQPDIQNMLEQKRLRVQHGRNMTTEEINEFYAESICVWNLYTRSNQSGVLPNALMMGTPVLASNSGVFTEIVKDNYNGFVINDITDCKKILDCYHHISTEKEKFSENARQTFLQNYYYKDWISKITTYLI